MVLLCCSLSCLLGHGTKLPSVLDQKPNFSGVVSIGGLDTPQQRLALLGGPSGVCEAIKRRRMAPSVKMFGFMMDMVGDNEESEAALLALMERENVRPDTIMLNMLVSITGSLMKYVLARGFGLSYFSD